MLLTLPMLYHFLKERILLNTNPLQPHPNLDRNHVDAQQLSFCNLSGRSIECSRCSYRTTNAKKSLIFSTSFLRSSQNLWHPRGRDIGAYNSLLYEAKHNNILIAGRGEGKSSTRNDGFYD